jgi:hypothetical protein
MSDRELIEVLLEVSEDPEGYTGDYLADLLVMAAERIEELNREVWDDR